MSDSRPWSDNPNAPKISYSLYFQEKANFAGFLLASILYGKHPTIHVCPLVFTSFARLILGIAIVLFFKCMAALVNPAHRKKEGIKWGFIIYTMVMFSFVTVLTGIQLNIQSISYIDNREFPGDDVLPPGPLGYQSLIYSEALSVVPNVMFLLNGCLAAGLLVSPLSGVASTRAACI